jgi:hypothetical protein
MPPTERVLPPISEVGFLGMHATSEHTVPLRYVGLAENFYLDGRAWKMRPGIRQAGSQLTGGSGKPVQMVAHFEALDGTYYTVAICNADLFTYNWATNAWAQTDLATKSITIDSSAKCDWAVSRGRLIVTDGVNKPFMFDPSGPTYTTLTNAPIAGGDEIYYDKAFLYDLPGANGNVFEWSDEGDPVNGYAGENQDWEFAQTDGGPVTCMVGLNEKMVVMKEDSIALLKGAVEDSFQTDAVREGVSETEGTMGKWNVVVVEGDVYHIAKTGPRTISGGYRLLPLDRDSENVNTLGPHWDEFDTNELANAIVFYDRKRNHIVWLTALAGETAKYEGLLYSIEEGSFSRITFASTWDFQCAASVENLTGEELVMLGDDDGNVWIYGEDNLYTDNTAGYLARIRSRQYGSSLGTVEKRIVQVDLTIHVASNPATFSTRAFIDGITDLDYFSSTDRARTVQRTGKYKYRRGMNHVGETVGWELRVSSDEGVIELHQAQTQLTASAVSESNG